MNQQNSTSFSYESIALAILRHNLHFKGSIYLSEIFYICVHAEWWKVSGKYLRLVFISKVFLIEFGFKGNFAI